MVNQALNTQVSDNYEAFLKSKVNDNSIVPVVLPPAMLLAIMPATDHTIFLNRQQTAIGRSMNSLMSL
jgi:hypothetical protein